MVRCNICEAPTKAFARAQVLGKYDVEYFRCPSCGFVQTEHPYWLDEAYASALLPADVGVVARNLKLANVTQVIINTFFPDGRRFLDFGGGYGLFVRLMRDRGFDYRWADEHAENVLSRGFEAEPNDGRYDLTTAFEVFEHLIDPVGTARDMLNRSGAVLFSTMLLPVGPPKPHEWWYYALFGGQHISLFSERALHVMAERCGVRAYSNASTVHMLSHTPVNAAAFRLVTRQKLATLLTLFHRRPSLTQQDFEYIAARDAAP